MSRNIMVTGGCGFIGANFIKMILESDSECKIINVDALTYAANPSFLDSVADDPRYVFIKADIRDLQKMRSIISDQNISGIIHFAAESHVDNSINRPAEFIETNIVGTFNLLEAARGAWLTSPFTSKPGLENHRFLHVSTDEVFGTLGETGYFTEESPYAPNSPYSASKASSDLLVRSYHHTYGLNTVITNCSNNFGPNQHDEKLIPVIIRNALAGRPIPIYGDGKNVRDWLFVRDHVRGIWDAYLNGKSGETYCIGGDSERTNLEVAASVCSLLQKSVPRADGYESLITMVTDRPGHDRRYAIDASKIKKELSWKASESFESGMAKTVEWYLKKYR